MKFRTRPRFEYRLWRWAGINESLFNLTPDELDWFKRFVEEAQKMSSYWLAEQIVKMVKENGYVYVNEALINRDFARDIADEYNLQLSYFERSRVFKFQHKARMHA